MSRGIPPSGASYSIGDLDFAFLTADHDGWYLLNGRALTALPASAQASAALLGFVGNLPNATDKAVRPQGAMGSTGGGTSKVVKQAHLPKIVLNGNTPSGGAHDHGMPGTPYLGTTGNPVANTNQNQADIPGSALGINGGNVNNPHNHTLTATLDGAANTPITVRTPYRSMNAFVYLG